MSSHWPPGSRPTTSYGPWKSGARVVRVDELWARVVPTPTSAPCCQDFRTSSFSTSEHELQRGHIGRAPGRSHHAFALECIGELITEDKKAVEVTPEAYWQYNEVLDRAQAKRVHMDRRVHTFYQAEFGRSAANGAIDARLLWEWLRDPRDPEWANPKADEDPIMQMRDAISPYFGHDLVIS